jgi:D-amino peptidase
LKIYIMTDLEGVAGVVQWEGRKDESPWNIHARKWKARLLTAEVNAAVDGAFAAGATEVVVDDSHGGAYTIDFEQLDGRARVLHGRDRPCIMAGLDESFAGMLVVGAHAMARTRGAVLYHTMSLETREIRINGKPFGEIGIFAFVAGAFGVPTLMVTGDAAACREAATLVPGVMTVAVKDGLSRYSAISHSAMTARRMIREAACEAVRRRAAIKPMVLEPPFTYQEDSFPAQGDIQASSPAKLPATWTTGEEIRATTARELIDKVWSRDV